MEVKRKPRDKHVLKASVDILDAVRSTVKPITASEVFNLVQGKMGLSASKIWLARLRKDIDEARPYSKGYHYDKKLNPSNRQKQFVYWFNEKQ